MNWGSLQRGPLSGFPWYWETGETCIIISLGWFTCGVSYKMAGDIHSMEILCNSRERENERERGRERNDCGEQFTMPAHAVTIIMTEQENIWQVPSKNQYWRRPGLAANKQLSIESKYVEDCRDIEIFGNLHFQWKWSLQVNT